MSYVVEREEKFLKVKAQHVKTLFPRSGQGTLGEGDNTWGIVIWSIVDIEDGDPVTNYLGEIVVTGEYADGIDPRETYVLLGKEVEHPQYGTQYQLVYYTKSVDFTKVRNQRAFLKVFLTENQMEQIFKLYDNPLEIIANHDVDALKKVHGIGDYIAHRIIRSFEELKDVSEVYLELDKCGVTTNMINKLIDHYKAPQKLINIVKNNPYQLVKDINGVGFATADKIALLNGFTTSDLRRVKAYILWCLDAQGENGHSYVSASELLGGIYSDLGGKEAVYEELVNLETGEITNNISLAISQLEKDGEIVLEKEGSKANRRIYLTKYWELELSIAYHLKRLLNGANTFIVEDFDEKIKGAEESQGFQFTKEQLDGIKLGIEKQVCVISGLAGTGKSSLVSGILAVLNEYSFAQCALSGKAAARLQEVTGQEGFTIHRLLGFGREGFSYNASNPLPHNIIILDEISLVGGEIFLRLLEAIPTGTKLIMLGDMGQLEAIGPLNIAADLCNSGVIPVVNLKEVHRQAKASGILTTAYDVRNQIQLWYESDYENVETRGELKDMILDIATEKTENRRKALEYFEKYYSSDLVKGDIEKIQIIAPVKERGDCCVFNLNLDVQALINPVGEKAHIHIKKKKDASGNDKSFYIQVDDKVMCIKNNYKVFNIKGELTQIYNGWTGVVKYINQREMCVDFSLGASPVLIPYKDVKDYLVLGYASTVHKLQGSSADVVIGVVDYSTPPMMLTCQLVYTLLTRAKKLCVLIGQTSAIGKAINSNYVSTKRTFLPEFVAKEYSYLKKDYDEKMLANALKHAQKQAKLEEENKRRMEEQNCFTMVDDEEFFEI